MPQAMWTVQPQAGNLHRVRGCECVISTLLLYHRLLTSESPDCLNKPQLSLLAAKTKHLEGNCPPRCTLLLSGPWWRLLAAAEGGSVEVSGMNNTLGFEARRWARMERQVFPVGLN